MNCENLFTDYLLKVHARSNRDEVVKKSDNKFEIFTTAPAEHNLANLTIVRMLSIYLHVPQKNVVIIRGGTSPNKTVRVYN